MASENEAKSLLEKLFLEDEETTLDKLPDDKREIVERATTHMLVHFARHLSTYAFFIVRKLEDRGLRVNLNYDLRKFKRAVVITIMFDLKDVKPELILHYFKYFFKKAGTDRWAKWTFFKVLKEISNEIVEEATDEYLNSEPNKEEEEEIQTVSK